MKKTKLELEEINDQEEVYFNSDSESNKENIKSKTNQSNNSNQQRASCDNQSNNQIYQDSSQSPKQKEDNQSELDEEILSEESLAMKKRKKKSKNSSDALVTKPISKKNNQKYKNRLNKQRGDQCFFAKKDDDHHHNEQLINENIQITQKNIQDVIDKAKYYFNEIFNSKFFEEVAQLASYSIFEQNYKIDSEDIKKFTAFLLCTSNHKIDSISNYFNNPFLNISDIIPIQLFFFISSCLAARTQNLHELSKLLLKQIDQSLIMDSSFLGFQLELSKDNPNLIKSNCLDFFNDFIFDYFHKKILINPSYYQKNQPFFSDKSSLLFFSTNPRFRSINIYYQQEKKVSFKLLRDQILEQKLIFNNEATQLKCSPNSLPDLLYNQQINKLKEEQEEKEEISQNKNDSKEETQKCFFYYNPSTLQLVSIQVELIREKTSNSKHSKSKQNKKISTQEVYQIESTNLNPSIIQNIVFQDNNNAIQTKLLKQIFS